MIRAVIHFELKPGCEQAFVAGFADVFRAVEKQKGYVTGELCRRDTPEGTRYMVTTVWKTPGDYGAWQALHAPENVDKATWMRSILDTLKSIPVGVPYRILETSHSR